MKILPRIKHIELNPLTLSTEELEFSLILLNLEHGRSENAFVQLTCCLLRKEYPEQSQTCSITCPWNMNIEKNDKGTKVEGGRLILLQCSNDIISHLLTEIFAALLVPALANTFIIYFSSKFNNI